MTNWLQERYLDATIKEAITKSWSDVGRYGDEISGLAILFLDMFLYNVVFYQTDDTLGTGNLVRKDERLELVFRSIKFFAKQQAGRNMSVDEKQGWATVIAAFGLHFERLVTSNGGMLALCKPICSHIVAMCVSTEMMGRIFPSAEHRRTFDQAATRGAVHLLNWRRSNSYQVINEKVFEPTNFDVPDLFLSYATEERGIASLFADSLNHLRVSTWFDRSIGAGSDFARVIDGKLELAKIVLVLWSPASVVSKWVQAQALYGFNMGKLIGVMIKPCSLPVPFNATQCIAWPPQESGSPDKWYELLNLIGPRLERSGLAQYVVDQLDPLSLAAWKEAHKEDPLAADHGLVT